MQTTIIRITGTHCESCKALLEEVIREVPGVHACTVNYRTGQTEVQHDERLDWQAVTAAVEGLGEYRMATP